jgi:hypothetical protein
MSYLWQVSPTFLLRRAGFPFGLLSSLAGPGIGDEAARLLAAQDAAERSRRALLSTHFPAAVRRARDTRPQALSALSKARRSVGRQAVVPLPDVIEDAELRGEHARWTALRAELDQERALWVKTVESAREASSRELTAIAAREDVQAAAFVLSPSIYAALARWQDAGPTASAGDRSAFDRLLYSVLQRLASKNETNSFFGPVTFGRFEGDEVRMGPESPRGFIERRAYVSFWAAAAIAKAATREPGVAALMPVRRLPIVRVEGSRAVLPGRPAVSLDDSDVSLLAAVNGTRSVTDLAAIVGRSVADTDERVTRLERAAVLQRAGEPSSSCIDPLADALAQLPDGRQLREFRARTDELRSVVADYAVTPMPARIELLERAERIFTEITGLPARRRAGGTYADRSILYEDCVGDLMPVSLPDDWRRRVSQSLAPVLDVGLAVGQADRLAHRDLARRVLAARGGSMGYLEFAGELQARYGELDDGPVRGVEERLRALVAASLGSACPTTGPAAGSRPAGAGPIVARLDAAELAAVAVPGGDRQAFVSPDLLLSGHDGSGPIVLGELHPYVFAWGLQGKFDPDPGPLTREVDDLLGVWGGERELAIVMHRRRHKGLISERFPGTFIEVTGRVGAGARLPVAALRVTLDAEGQPTLMAPDGRPLTLYVGEDDQPHLRVFAPAPVKFPRVWLGDDAPRIVVGEVVAQRAQWRLSQESLSGGPGQPGAGADLAGVLASLFRLRAERGVPRHVYARSAAEVKPLYLDLDLPVAAEVLSRLLAKGPVTLSEMLPDPAQLWLRHRASALTSELRLAVHRLPREGRTP